jgi:hypothetical protein
VTLEGGDETTFSLFLPGDVVPFETGNYVNLVLSHTTPQTGTQADLTIAFNNSTLGIIPLTPENATRSPLRFELPGDLLQAGRNQLYMRLNSGGSCGAIPQDTVVALIHTDSLFHLEYTSPPRQPDLAVYPLPFYERTFLPSTVYFVLPQNPTITDISTAVSISAGLGLYSQGQVQIASVLETELTDEIRQNNHLILVGRPDANNLLTELDLPVPLDSPLIKDSSGVLQEIVSPWNPNKMVLVVTGRTDAGLIKAGDVLNRDLNFLGMKGPIAIVEEVLPPAQTTSRRQVDITFEVLGYEDVTFSGTRLQVRRFEFWMPQAWEMAEQPKLYLSFNHSTVIDPVGSTLNVELNSVPVGGVALDAQNAINGILEIELPTWLLRSGANRLEVATSMVVNTGDPCFNEGNPQVWTVVRRDSYIHLPYIEQEAAFDLSLFPYPFVVDTNLTNVSLVLPDVLSRPERERLLQLAAALGRQAGGDRITLRAISPQDIDEVKESNHFIVFGRPTNNPLLPTLNDMLPQPFRVDTDQLAPGLDSAILTETTTRSAGLLQELTSPWNSERAILVITGTTDEGVAAAFDLLLGNLPEEWGRVSLKGNVAVIEGQRIHSTDTRLLEGQALSQRPAQVAPVAVPGALPQRELASRWW